VKHPGSGVLQAALEAALEAYRDALVAAPLSVTSVREPEAAWLLHVEDALAAVPVIAELGPGPVVDVGAGGGSPGIPLALVTGQTVTLLEARAPKAAFLRATVNMLQAPCEVVHARSEEYARAAGRDAFAIALSRAVAPPPVAAELCLPLVRPGGRVVLWVAELDESELDRAAGRVAGRLERVVSVSERRRLAVIVKTGLTPEQFPRRAGLAGRRPLR
jgi:16S rRNA (guanine527-N7)-methyltransferase